MSKDLYRKIIMDHYKFPNNKLEDDQESKLISMLGHNPSCGDEVEIFLDLENDIIKEVFFKGNGCSICCSSASILTQEFEGLSVIEAEKKIQTFENMLKGNDFNENEFDDAICFESLKDFPARFKCAFISWDTLKKMLQNGGKNES